MSSWTTIELDTTPPSALVLDRTRSGQEITLLMGLTEPSIAVAQLRLEDGRYIDTNINGTLISVVLPEDTPGTMATLEIDLIDDVGNSDSQSIPVIIGSGQIEGSSIIDLTVYGETNIEPTASVTTIVTEDVIGVGEAGPDIDIDYVLEEDPDAE